jgi:hypothetical protein
MRVVLSEVGRPLGKALVLSRRVAKHLIDRGGADRRGEVISV